MDWYLDRFRYRTYIWCKDKWMVQLRLEQTFEVHQKYIRYILNVGGRNGKFFSGRLIRHFKTDKEKGRAILSTRQDWIQIREQRMRHC